MIWLKTNISKFFKLFSCFELNFAKNRKRLKIKQKNDFGKEKNKIWYGQIDPIHRIIINFFRMRVKI